MVSSVPMRPSSSRPEISWHPAQPKWRTTSCFRLQSDRHERCVGIRGRSSFSGCQIAGHVFGILGEGGGWASQSCSALEVRGRRSGTCCGPGQDVGQALLFVNPRADVFLYTGSKDACARARCGPAHEVVVAVLLTTRVRFAAKFRPATGRLRRWSDRRGSRISATRTIRSMAQSRLHCIAQDIRNADAMKMSCSEYARLPRLSLHRRGDQLQGGTFAANSRAWVRRTATTTSCAGPQRARAHASLLPV